MLLQSGFGCNSLLGHWGAPKSFAIEAVQLANSQSGRAHRQPCRRQQTATATKMSSFSGFLYENMPSSLVSMQSLLDVMIRLHDHGLPLAT